MVIKRIRNIAIGCVGIVILLIILGAIFGGIIIKKLISGAIQQKTGVTVNVDDINQGKLTYTDPKTGQTLNIGANKIPDGFPKDFPVYPGSTVTSSLSGSQTGQENGYWLTLTTNDSAEKVTAYYETNFEKEGWKTQTTNTPGNGTSWAVSKDTLSGYVTVTTASNQTSILVVLGNASPAPVNAQ
ncbi:hypothetical protein BH10PAT1_BH10PAT1_2260 [soil metagenome]